MIIAGYGAVGPAGIGGAKNLRLGDRCLKVKEGSCVHRPPLIGPLAWRGGQVILLEPDLTVPTGPTQRLNIDIFPVPLVAGKIIDLQQETPNRMYLKGFLFPSRPIPNLNVLYECGTMMRFVAGLFCPSVGLMAKKQELWRSDQHRQGGIR